MYIDYDIAGLFYDGDDDCCEEVSKTTQVQLRMGMLEKKIAATTELRDAATIVAKYADIGIDIGRVLATAVRDDVRAKAELDALRQSLQTA